ncbi:MAG: acyl-CoA thioester hydrolase YciA [Buchnera aphidicola (Periphyllus acericola)]|uniref:acyl-CoA thioester hydrolase YciA n=1 Tax=Buchnera aphidicola TaxID=9 RepID=UPI0030CBC63A|nr:acyl-CoA thioester hydrolase YciA [Buchnera aphidicola (Periphyllus acericola)]
MQLTIKNLNVKNKKNLLLKTLAMPHNTNANGDIFGGWIMSQMDIGGAILAKQIAMGRVVTVQSNISFLKSISIGDIINCYGKCIKKGSSSMKIKIEIWVKRLYSKPIKEKYLSTKGTFFYVAIDENGQPKKIFKKK